MDSQVVLTHSLTTLLTILCLSQTPILSSHHGLPLSHQLSPPTPTTTKFLPPPRLTFRKLKLSYIHLHNKQTRERKKELSKKKKKKSYSEQWSGVDGKRQGENGSGGEPEMQVASSHNVALDILGKDSSLAVAREPYTDKTALHVLARKPSAMGTGSELGIWKRSVNSCFKVIYHKDLMQTLANRLVENLWKEVVKRPENEIACLLATPSRLLSDAAALGNVEFLVVLFRSYPDLFWKVDNRNRSLFHIAVENRQESVFNLIYEIGAIKDLIAAYKDDETNNNMLHLAGKLAPRNRLQIVSGAALQLQRELLWFEAVEKIVPPSYLKLKNINEQTPRDLFLESHKELLEKGEKWMIDTATSSMLVATLIATVVFAAAFTVPGGNNNDTGIPVFEREKWFTIFVLSDAVALFSSTVSILMFLSILTARYTEEDFLWSLPSRLVFGLSALFISIAAMLLAFSTVFFLVHDHRLKWIPTLIISLGCFLVILFAFLHYSLWLDIIRSTFRSRFLFRPHKLRLY